MLRSAMDHLLDNKIVPVVIVLAHVAALAWALWSGAGSISGLRKSPGPVLALNLAIAAGILIYNASDIAIVLRQADVTILMLMAFALATLVIAAGALFGLRIPTALIWITFAGNFILSLLYMAVALLFKMNRLF